MSAFGGKADIMGVPQCPPMTKAANTPREVRNCGTGVADGWNICVSSKIIISSATRVYLRHVPGFALGEVLACPRVDKVPIPPTPSFICQCVQCGARIWVAHGSPIEPVRACVACSAAHDDQVRQAKQHRAMRPDEDRTRETLSITMPSA